MRLIQRLHPPRPCASSTAMSVAQTLALCLSALCVLLATYNSLEHSQRAAVLHRRSLRRAAYNPATVAVQYSAVRSGSNSDSDGDRIAVSGGSDIADSGGSSGIGSDVSAADSAALALCLVTKVEADDPQWRDGRAQDLIEVWH